MMEQFQKGVFSDLERPLTVGTSQAPDKKIAIASTSDVVLCI